MTTEAYLALAPRNPAMKTQLQVIVELANATRYAAAGDLTKTIASLQAVLDMLGLESLDVRVSPSKAGGHL